MLFEHGFNLKKPKLGPDFKDLHKQLKALTDKPPKDENWSLGEVIHFHSLLMGDNFSHNKLY